MSEAQFQEAAAKAKTFTSRPQDKELLELYGLFKQATEGDCTTPEPGFLDLKGKAKWKSWNSRKGMSKEDARKAYIKLVDELSKHYK